MVKIIEEQKNTITELQQENHLLKEQLTYLKRMMFGVKKETIIDDGAYLPNFEMPKQDEVIEPEEKVLVKKAKNKRKPFTHFDFPKDAPREKIINDLSPEDKKDLKYIGNDEIEKLAYRPGSFYVKVFITRKYVDPLYSEKGIITNTSLSSAIPGSRVDESMLANLLVNKYCDHLPLYRLERIYARDGLNIQRQTLSSWALKSGALLHPLADLLLNEIMDQQVVFTDDTTIPLQVKGNGKTKTARMWIYVSGGGADPPLVYYQFTKDRKNCHPLEKFKDYKGAFHSDAFSAYETIANFDDVTWQPCWAHARRKFFDTLTSHQLKGIILDKIDKLFAIERDAWNIDKEDIPQWEKSKKRLNLRQEQSSIVVDEIFSEVKTSFKSGYHMPGENLTKAMIYLMKREDAFKSFLNNSELRIDNNVSERNIRPLTLGRKNWLFVGSEDGGRTTATILSLVQTCKNLKINPQEYLEDVLRRINNTSKNDLFHLLPQNWKKD